MSSQIVIAGHGHIGSYVHRVLTERDYHATSYDLQQGYDLSQPATIHDLLSGAEVVIDTLPYRYNRLIAEYAVQQNIAYFNLTEDVENTQYIRKLASSGSWTAARAPLVPQCGLAPGMVNIIAHHLAQSFTTVESIHIRVGALPAQKHNHLGYALTWNPAGLVNEYCNPCQVLHGGVVTTVSALDGEETITVQGRVFEAAYTSGGIGTLAETWGQASPPAQNVTYKTLRYPGHFAFMRVLRDDLHLHANKDLAELWFARALPHTTEDIVVISIHVTGTTSPNGAPPYTTRTYEHIVYGDALGTAIQRTTAHGVLSVMDAYLSNKFSGAGFMKQEEIPYRAIADSWFSQVYKLSLVV
jgi:saccharopine dehydrogenase-like NADP-dependent oxidoreductase